MRKGEIISVRHRDWNEDERTLTILKTKNGENRTIPLSSRASEILREHGSDSGRLFPIGPDGLRCAWVRSVKRGKLSDFRFHDLRHEAISRLFEAGLSIPEVALISGHKTYSQLAVYTHINAAAVLPKLD
jgi:integrase